MIEEAIEIRTADGTSDGFLYREEAGRRWPAVIHLTDIGGIRPDHPTWHGGSPKRATRCSCRTCFIGLGDRRCSISCPRWARSER